ncbi:putative VP2 [Microviridae sp.]|nr:putative VP2 [Microviridae sp.]
MAFLDSIPLIGSAISSIAGLFGSSHNASLQEKQNERNIQYQIAENEKNRLFNSSQASIARNFSANFAREMYDKQYRDNSYSSQIAQMKAAGINPALAYSSGNFAVASMPSASSPSASSSGSVSSQVAPQIDPSYMADIALKAAQIENINAQTKKTEAETVGQGYTNEILKSDAAFRDAFNKGDLELKNVSIEFGKSKKNLTDEQITETRLECKKLDYNIEYSRRSLDLLAEQIESGELDNSIKRIELAFKEPTMQAQLDNLVAITGKTKAECQSIIKLLPYQIAQYGADIAYKNAMTSLCAKQGVLVEAQTNNTNEQTRFVIKQQDTEEAKTNYYNNEAYKANMEGKSAAEEADWQQFWLRDTERVAKSLGNILTLGLLPD